MVKPTVPLAARGLGLVATELGRCSLDRVVPGNASVPKGGGDITAPWLESAMGLLPGTIRSVTVVDENHGTASRARLAVDADPAAGLPDHLFIKLTPQNFVQHVMMNVMDLGVREVLFYDVVADDAPIRVPRCHAVRLDARRGRNVIVLEDLDGARFRDVRQSCDATEAEAIAVALADLHVAFWESDRFGVGGDLASLVSRPEPATWLGDLFVRRILGDLKGQAAELVPPDIQRKSRVLLDQKDAVTALWADEPQTLIHGDTHLGNLFFEGATPGFLDWQAVMVGPGIRDLAYFVGASVEPALAREIERSLVDRYGKRLADAGIDVDADHLWTMYRATMADFYIAAVVTAGTGDRMQPQEISRSGVERAVAAVAALETFDILAAAAAGERL